MNTDSEEKYSGTRAELIAAGLAADGQFPGDAGCPNRTAYTFKRDTRSVTVRVRPPVGFWVLVGQTADEKKIQRAKDRARVAEWRREAQQQERDRVTKARAEAEEKLAKVPKNPEAYREQMVDLLETLVHGFVKRALTGRPSDDWLYRGFIGPTGGYTIDADSLAAFEEAIDDAAQSLRNATVRCDTSVKRRERAEILGNVAKGDAAFGRFMSFAADTSSVP